MLWWAIAVARAADPDPAVEIEVFATDDPAETSASVTVVTVDARLPASTDVGDAVGSVPGATVRRLGGLGDFAAVSIRGSSARQVALFLDGMPLNPEGAAVIDLSELPLRAFERVEVYRGNAPPELGAAAIGGVVHLVTGDGGGSAGALSAGSWGTLAGHASTRVPVGSGDLRLFADGLHTDGRFTYFDDRGTPSTPDDDLFRTRENNDRTQGSALARLRVGPWTVLQSATVKESGVPGYTWLPFTAARFRVIRDLQGIGWDRAAGNWSFHGRAWGLARDERLDDPLGETAFVPRISEALTAGGGARGVARWAPRPTTVGIGAVEARGDALRVGDGTAGAWVAGRRAATGTMSAVVRDRADHVAVTPVVQGTALRDTADGADPLTTAYLAPRVGVLAGTDRIALTANVGRYLRPPDLQERYGDEGALVGNPDLLPERGVQADLGLRARVGFVRAEAIGFAGVARDRITWLQNAQGVARPENLDRVDTVGAEGALAVTTDRVDWSGNLTWTHAVQAGSIAAWDGQPVPGVPALEGTHRVGVGSTRVRIGHTLDASSGTWLDAAGFYRTAPRWIHGASAKATDGPLTIEVEVRNLLDRITEQTPRDPLVDDGTLATRAVTDFFGYPLPGRTFLLTLRLAESE